MPKSRPDHRPADDIDMDDPSRPARGCITGIAMMVVFWAMVALVVFALR